MISGGYACSDAFLDRKWFKYIDGAVVQLENERLTSIQHQHLEVEFICGSLLLKSGAYFFTGKLTIQAQLLTQQQIHYASIWRLPLVDWLTRGLVSCENRNVGPA